MFGGNRHLPFSYDNATSGPYVCMYSLILNKNHALPEIRLYNCTQCTFLYVLRVEYG